MNRTSDTTSWRKLLKEVTDELGEEVLICTLSDDGLDTEFDDGFGCAEGLPFTAWTKSWVLFPLEYDGAESVGRAPRNPCATAMGHQ